MRKYFNLFKIDFGNLQSHLEWLKINKSVSKIPQLDCLICRTACKDVGVGVEGDWINIMSMAGHGSEQVACSWIPELDCVICRTAGKDVGVGVEGDWPKHGVKKIKIL